MASPPSNDFYTSLFNFLDYACTAIPVTTVSQEEDPQDPQPETFYNLEDEAVYKLCKQTTLSTASSVCEKTEIDETRKTSQKRFGTLQSGYRL